MSQIETDNSAAPKSAFGFTLIELITSAVVSVLLAVAVLAFNSLIVNNRLTTQATDIVAADIVAAINLARSEAIKRNASVSFCRAGSATASTCATAASTWQHWIVRTTTGNVVRRGTVNTHDNKIVVRSTLITDQADFGSAGVARTGGVLVNDHQLSVCATEWPTLDSVANLGNDDVARVYVGYFDAGKCYKYSYSANEPDRHFYPVSTTATRTCGNTQRQWSGNYLNWAATQTIDPFRKALTGGYRVRDTATET